MPREPQDPYAPPPRHKERSGAVVRLAVVAALIGAAAWGYMEYSQQPQTALVEPAAEEQTLADNSYDTAPVAPQTTPAPTATTGAPEATPPAQEPASAPDQPPA